MSYNTARSRRLEVSRAVKSLSTTLNQNFSGAGSEIQVQAMIDAILEGDDAKELCSALHQTVKALNKPSMINNLREALKNGDITPQQIADKVHAGDFEGLIQEVEAYEPPTLEQLIQVDPEVLSRAQEIAQQVKNIAAMLPDNLDLQDLSSNLSQPEAQYALAHAGNDAINEIVDLVLQDKFSAANVTVNGARNELSDLQEERMALRTAALKGMGEPDSAGNAQMIENAGADLGATELTQPASPDAGYDNTNVEPNYASPGW